MYGFLKVLLSKSLKKWTNTGPGHVSSLGPVQFSLDPEDFSPVQPGTPGTLGYHDTFSNAGLWKSGK